MTHGCAKVVMPIRPMQPVILIEIHHVGDILKGIIRSIHICIFILDVNVEYTSNSRVLPGASGDYKFFYKRISLISK